MSRRRQADKREILPDAKFGDKVVTKFMNYVMYEGKKAVAENILYGAFDILEAKRKDLGPLETFHTALDNVAPAIEVRSRRVGGATYQVPVEVPARRSRTLAVRWLVQFARARREYSMAERLASEIIDATQQQGSAWKRKRPGSGARPNSTRLGSRRRRHVWRRCKPKWWARSAPGWTACRKAISPSASNTLSRRNTTGCGRTITPQSGGCASW